MHVIYALLTVVNDDAPRERHLQPDLLSVAAGPQSSTTDDGNYAVYCNNGNYVLCLHSTVGYAVVILLDLAQSKCQIHWEASFEFRSGSLPREKVKVTHTPLPSVGFLS